MRKNGFVILAVIFLLLLGMTTASANQGISVYLDEEILTFDVPPMVQKERTLVPMRAIFENLGATVEWDQTTQTAKATKGAISVGLTIGSGKMMRVDTDVDKTEIYNLDVPAMAMNGRTLIPLRAVSEAFSCQVEWNGHNNSVSIFSENYVLNHQPQILDSGILPVGKYTLRYVDADGVMEDYAEIFSFKITKEGENAQYKGFIPENCAPVGATAIGVFNSSNEKVKELSLGSLKTSGLGKKLYSFAALSDSHIGVRTGEEDLTAALQYFENEEDIAFTVICGDLTHNGDDEQLTTWKSITDTYSSTPVYGISGNHEAGGPFSPLSMDALEPYTGQDLFYSFTHGDDVYIMVGMYQTHQSKTPFADGELQWLYETLEANRNKRCFVFMHLFPWNGSGDAVDCYGANYLNNTDGKVFYNLMKHYKNAMWFHGHSHAKFELQEVNYMNTYDNNCARHSIHIPSLASPADIAANGTNYSKDYNGSEGYIVDVYENKIVLRGRDFISGKFLPIASYLLDTSIKNVKENSYFDSTGIVLNSNTNVLKSGNSWYNSSADKSTITSISFSEDYNVSDYDESWDVTVNNSGKVMAYRKGTELTIASKIGISLNANSTSLFEGFSGVTNISGLDKLNTSNITKFQSVFKDCSSLKEVDISSFDLSKVRYLNSLFYGCSSLESFKLPNNINTSQNSYNMVYVSDIFSKCSSIKEIDLRGLPGKNIYIFGSSFNECSMLESVKFGSFSIYSMGSAFYKCNKLKTVDMSNCDFSTCTTMVGMFRNCSSLTTIKLPKNMDTSKVENMSAAFYNCKSLILDCSDWKVTSGTNTDNFNYNAPGVIAPEK